MYYIYIYIYTYIYTYGRCNGDGYTTVVTNLQNWTRGGRSHP